MGGGSGGISSIDLSKLTKAAEERLKQLAQSGTRILFACELPDRKSLDSHLARSKVFDPRKIDITDSSKGEVFSSLVEKASMVIVFTDTATSTSFLDKVVEVAFAKKRQGAHAKAKNNSLIPAKASAYRWPSLVWEKLEEMFS